MVNLPNAFFDEDNPNLNLPKVTRLLIYKEYWHRKRLENLDYEDLMLLITDADTLNISIPDNVRASFWVEIDPARIDNDVPPALQAEVPQVVQDDSDPENIIWRDRKWSEMPRFTEYNGRYFLKLAVPETSPSPDGKYNGIRGLPLNLLAQVRNVAWLQGINQIPSDDPEV